MRALRTGLSALFPLLLGVALWGQAPCPDGIAPDAQGYVDSFDPGDFDTTPPFYAAVRCWWWICRVRRSYLHFPAAALPACVGKATLWLKVDSVYRSPQVEVREAYWDGTPIAWDAQPAWGPALDSGQLGEPGWVSFDVTEAVRRYVAGDIDDLAFVVKLYTEWSPVLRGMAFSEACLAVEPCVEVTVRGLSDFTVTQEFFALDRYAPLGELRVTIRATVGYRARVCYEVQPAPNPPFGADPVELEYPPGDWFTVPRCPVYTELPGFSGDPGEEDRTYRVRVDLADLGDRAAGEEFLFVIRVEAIPQ
ncbi:MAG: DNRLRE domain-containing protein [Caldiserica bacterium]|nr:DNRLRE domain-containing protein [Caldisericota bacterium]